MDEWTDRETGRQTDRGMVGSTNLYYKCSYTFRFPCAISGSLYIVFLRLYVVFLRLYNINNTDNAICQPIAVGASSRNTIYELTECGVRQGNMEEIL
jgi:hypothetical protein